MADQEKKTFVMVATAAKVGEPITGEVSRAPNLRGKQDDHATAFSILKQLLFKVMGSSHSDERLHTTPVITKLFILANQEISILQASGLIDLSKLLEEIKTLISKIEPGIDLKKEFYDFGSVDDSLRHVITICEKFFQKKENKSSTFLPHFLELYSKIVPYQNLRELIEELNKNLETAKESAITKAQELTERLTQQFKTEITSLAGVPELPIATKMGIARQLAIAAFPGVQDAYARTTIGEMVDINATYLNKLPFVTFKPIEGVSGKNRHGDGAVSAAIENLKIACTKEKVDDAAIYVALLLDFYPLSLAKLKEQKDLRAEIIQGKTGDAQSARFYSRASHLALTRNNDELVFAYVVARHWQLLCDAFPELKDCPKKEEIKLKFVNHMLTRWRFADLTPEKKTPKSEGGYPGSYVQEKEETKTKQEMAEGIIPVTSRWELTSVNVAKCQGLIMGIIGKYEAYVSSAPPSPASLTLSDVELDAAFSSSSPTATSPPKPSSSKEQQILKLQTSLAEAQQQIIELQEKLAAAQKQQSPIAAPSAFSGALDGIAMVLGSTASDPGLSPPPVLPSGGLKKTKRSLSDVAISPPVVTSFAPAPVPTSEPDAKKKKL